MTRTESELFPFWTTRRTGEGCVLAKNEVEKLLGKNPSTGITVSLRVLSRRRDESLFELKTTICVYIIYSWKIPPWVFVSARSNSVFSQSNEAESKIKTRTTAITRLTVNLHVRFYHKPIWTLTFSPGRTGKTSL